MNPLYCLVLIAAVFGINAQQYVQLNGQPLKGNQRLRGGPAQIDVGYSQQTGLQRGPGTFGGQSGFAQGALNGQTVGRRPGSFGGHGIIGGTGSIGGETVVGRPGAFNGQVGGQTVGRRPGAFGGQSGFAQGALNGQTVGGRPGAFGGHGSISGASSFGGQGGQIGGAQTIGGNTGMYRPSARPVGVAVNHQNRPVIVGVNQNYQGKGK